MAMFLAALVPSTAIAHDFKTPLQDGVLAQFDGIIINGQNVNEAYESTKQQMVAAAKVKLDANDAKFNVVVREYNAKYEQERAMANIVSRMNAYGGNNSYNYLPTTGGYIHWLALQGVEEGCIHTSVAELERHATLFEERVGLWFDYINQKQKHGETEEEIYKTVSHEYINKLLTPFAQAK